MIFDSQKTCDEARNILASDAGTAGYVSHIETRLVGFDNQWYEEKYIPYISSVHHAALLC